MNSSKPTTEQTSQASFGKRLRHWRHQRNLSQLELAHRADISPRHLSFLETDRSTPSRDMALRLAERLDVPLRDRNVLLNAAGYAAMYRERPLDHPEMASARAAVDLILKCHEPYPALAMDRHWNLVAANRMVPLLLAGIDATLLQAPLNVLRLSLHPQGLAPRIANLGQWRRYLFERLRQQIQATGDLALQNLLDELKAYSVPGDTGNIELAGAQMEVLMPFQFQTEHGTLNLVSTITVFGSPVDTTLQEMALETFLPADALTADVLRHLMQTPQS